MTRRHQARAIRFANSSGGPSVPGAIRLAAWGVNRTVDGKPDYVLDKANAAALLEAFASYGNDLVVDYEHANLDRKTDGPIPAAGWIRQGGLELRADGLWATIDWNAEAAELISSKQYRYYSPTFMLDGKSRIVEVLPLTLTNFPATLGMVPLVASRTSKGKTMDKTLAEALQAALGEKMGGEQCEVLSVGLGSAVFKCGDQAMKIGFSMTPDGVTLEGEPEPADMPPAETSGEVAPAGASAEEPKPAAASRGDLASYVGAQDPEGAKAKIDRLREQAKTAVQLSARVQQLEAESNARELDRIIAEGRAKKVITNANEARIRSRGVSYARGYVEDAEPVRVSVNTGKTGGAKPGDEVTLTPAEVRVAKAAGRDPAKVLAAKRELLKKQAAFGAASAETEEDGEE